MPRSSYDIIVLGVGSMGAATCWQLARKHSNRRVLGLEQFDIPNTRSSHSGASRMFRLAYFEHPDYVALLQRAYDGWHALGEDCGRAMLHETGGLYMGRPDSELVSGSIDAARQYDLPHDVLDRGQLARQYPQFHVPDDTIALRESKAGFVCAGQTVGACARLAMQQGVELHAHEPAIDWHADGGKVTVNTMRGAYEAEQLVVTAGPWADRLLRDLGVRLTVTRQTLAWFWPHDPSMFQLGKMPCWALDFSPKENYRGLHYGFPMWHDAPANPGFKAGLHWPGEPCNPDDVDRTVHADDEATVRDALEQYIPDAAGRLLAIRTCLYTNTPDGHFIIDRHPRHDNVTIACGFSGHGFKFVPAVGEALADLAATGRTPLPIGFLGLSRFC